jgi:hypothetical protein
MIPNTLEYRGGARAKVGVAKESDADRDVPWLLESPTDGPALCCLGSCVGTVSESGMHVSWMSS